MAHALQSASQMIQSLLQNRPWPSQPATRRSPVLPRQKALRCDRPAATERPDASSRPRLCATRATLVPGCNVNSTIRRFLRHRSPKPVPRFQPRPISPCQHLQTASPSHSRWEHQTLTEHVELAHNLDRLPCDTNDQPRCDPLVPLGRSNTCSRVLIGLSLDPVQLPNDTSEPPRRCPAVLLYRRNTLSPSCIEPLLRPDLLLCGTNGEPRCSPAGSPWPESYI